MADKVELITYADRLGGDLPGCATLLRRAAARDCSAASTCCRSSRRTTAPTPGSTRATTPRSTRGSAPGTTSRALAAGPRRHGRT